MSVEPPHVPLRIQEAPAKSSQAQLKSDEPKHDNNSRYLHPRFKSSNTIWGLAATLRPTEA